jgi:REP element-mobilizing transposase RayT
MFHHVARSIGRRPLFRTWTEARVLWDALVRAAPGCAAFVIMPDHIHFVHPFDVRLRLARGISGFTRWRNHAHGKTERLFERLPPAEPLTDEQKVLRTIRYVHLNPCRGKLVNDPLAWPFSTHRDACALAIPAAVPRVADVWWFHRYVSSDPSVHVDGTELPGVTVATHDPGQVLYAVSALTRTSLEAMCVRGAPRSLYLRAAAELCPNTPRANLCELVGVHRNTYRNATQRRDPAVRTVARVIGDPRFSPLHDRPLSFLNARSSPTR